MYNYKKEFENALINTQELGLTPISFEESTNEKIFDIKDEESLCKTMYSISEVMSDRLITNLYIGTKESMITSLMSNCTPFHYKIKPYLEDLFQQKLYYTTGYINFVDDYNIETRSFHKLTISQYEDCIKNKKLHSNHHVWLTTENYEVIDLTFGLTLMYLQPEEFYTTINDPRFEPWMAMITRHYKDLSGGMQYHPMIIGEEFYFKSGFDLNSISEAMYK